MVDPLAVMIGAGTDQAFFKIGLGNGLPDFALSSKSAFKSFCFSKAGKLNPHDIAHLPTAEYFGSFKM